MRPDVIITISTCTSTLYLYVFLLLFYMSSLLSRPLYLFPRFSFHRRFWSETVEPVAWTWVVPQPEDIFMISRWAYRIWWYLWIGSRVFLSFSLSLTVPGRRSSRIHLPWRRKFVFDHLSKFHLIDSRRISLGHVYRKLNIHRFDQGQAEIHIYVFHYKTSIEVAILCLQWVQFKSAYEKYLMTQKLAVTPSPYSSW